MGEDQPAANGVLLWEHHLLEGLRLLAGDRTSILPSVDRSIQVAVGLGRVGGGDVLSCWE